MGASQCQRINAVQTQSRAELGLPFWDNRGGSRGTALGRIYRLFTVFFGAIQRLTGCSGSSRRFRNGVATVGTSQSLSRPSCLLHSPRSALPRLPDARNLEMPNCAPALVVSVSTTPITPSWLSQPPGCNSPATSQSASVPSWHAPSATAKRYQSVSAWEERGLRNQVDPLRPPSPHRPGPQQLHQLRLGR